MKPVLLPFYLTGGTALGRFYLNHRYSENLDFFTNADENFPDLIRKIEKKLFSRFSVLMDQSVVYEDFVRFYIEEEGNILKLEFVNDIAYRCSVPNIYPYGYIDTPLNILTNKLTAITGRDEPKDIFDIYSLACVYSFNWKSVFSEVMKKAVINELDVEQRIRSFPVELFTGRDWHLNNSVLIPGNETILSIANDFLLGADNSLGLGKPAIEKAKISGQGE